MKILNSDWNDHWFLSFICYYGETAVTIGWSLSCALRSNPPPSQVCPVSWGCFEGSFLCTCNSSLPAERSQWDASAVSWIGGDGRVLLSFLSPSTVSQTTAAPPPWLPNGPLLLENPGLGFWWHWLLLSLEAIISQFQHYGHSGATLILCCPWDTSLSDFSAFLPTT